MTKTWATLLGASLALAAFVWRIVHVRSVENAKIRAKLQRWRRSSVIQELCVKYGLSVDGGFLPTECVRRLSSPKFVAWEMIVDNLPELNHNGELASWIESLPVIDASDIQEEGELHRAYIVLTMLLHSYVHGPSVPWPRKDSDSSPSTSPSNRRVPPQLSVPLVSVCLRLGLPPVLTAAMDLWNWEVQGVRKFVKQHSSSTRAPRPEDLALISSMTGTRTERFFHMIPCSMQATLGPLITPLFLMPEHVLEKMKHAEGFELLVLEEQLEGLLLQLMSALNECQHRLSQIKTLVDRSTFYDVYRPLLNGFWPEGIVLEGVSLQDCLKISEASMKADEGGYWAGSTEAGRVVEGEGGLEVRAKGPSAGQSAVFFIVDALLGVSHQEEARAFQKEMAALYLPSEHRCLVQDFLASVARHGSVASYIERQGTDPSGRIAAALWQCRNVLASFRSRHLGVACSYLKQAEVGTGGSSFKGMLKQAWIASARPLMMPPFRV